MPELTIGESILVNALISVIKDYFITQGKTEPFSWPVEASGRVTNACASALAREHFVVEEGIAENGKSNWIRIF
ncbi:MAG: hypothetical protein AAB857_04525 [Patescibacteria group bacterium]